MKNLTPKAKPSNADVIKIRLCVTSTIVHKDSETDPLHPWINVVYRAAHEATLNLRGRGRK